MMSGYDSWLAGYRVDHEVEVWCPNEACGNHDGTQVTGFTEYGQSWVSPEECPNCHSEWLFEAPPEPEEDDEDES